MKKILVLAAAAMMSLSAFAWGQKGHDIVAHIAERNLTQAAADSLNSILEGKSAVYWANWLDNASHTPDYAYTKTWHYRNVDAGQTLATAPKEPKGDALTAIREQIAILADPNSAHSQRNLAMKILIHVTGDLHQPMHLGHLSDRGGNNHQVRFFNDGTNIHSVWDGRLVNTAHSWTYTEWADQLDRGTSEQKAALAAGNVDDWAGESVEIAGRIYDYFPTGAKISYNQIAYWTPTVEQQLLKGGLRLARILNALLDPEKAEGTSNF